jgi:hypothetical protein
VELADVFEARLAVSKPGYFDTTVHVRLDDSPRNDPSPDAPPADLFVTQRYMDRPAKVLDRPVEVVMVRGTQEPLHRVAGGLRATPQAPGCFFSLPGVSGPGTGFPVDPLGGPRVPLTTGAAVYVLADAGPDGGLVSAESWPGEAWARTPHRVRLCVTGGAGSGVVPVAGARSLADLAEAPADGYRNGLVLGPAFLRDAAELPGGGGRVLCFYVRHAAGATVTYGKGRIVFLPDREHVRGEAVLYSRDDGRRGLSTRPGRGE